MRIEVNPEAPVIGAADTRINAPIGIVWDVLSNLEDWPRWNKSVSRLQLKGEFKAGTSFVWVAGGSRIVSRLEQLEPPSRIVWSGRTMGIRAIHVWELLESDAATTVRTKESFDGIPVRLFRGLMRKMLESALAQGLEALKAESEARHALPGR